MLCVCARKLYIINCLHYFRGANLTQPGYLDPRTLAPGMSMGGGGLPPPIASTPVLMLYDLDPTKINCEKIFNLLCLYGNVVRVSTILTYLNSSECLYCFELLLWFWFGRSGKHFFRNYFKNDLFFIIFRLKFWYSMS